MLEAARQVGVARFHHVSTCEVYGDLPLDTDEVFTEDSPYRPRTPYNASKAGADHAVRAYAETYDLPITITNCANNYGPYQFPEKLIPHLLRAGARRPAADALRQHGEPPGVAARVRPLHGHRRRARPRPGGRDVPRRQRRRGLHHGGRRPDPRRARASRSRSRRSCPTGPATTAATSSTPPSCGASSAGSHRSSGSRDWRTRCSGTPRNRDWWEPLRARAPVVEGAWGTGGQLSGADPHHGGRRAARARPARRAGGTGADRRAPLRAARPRGAAPGSRPRGARHRHRHHAGRRPRRGPRHLHRVPARARPPRRRTHRGRPVRDRGRHRLRGERRRHPPRRRGGRPGGGARGLRVDRLRLRRHRRPPVPGVGRTLPDLCVRRLQAGGGAGVPPRVDHRAHELAVRRPRRQHGGDRAAPGRRRGGAPVRRRPARVADVHRRPGARHRHPRPRPASGHLPRDQRRRHDVVGLRAGGAGRGRCGPRPGEADQRRPSSTRPARRRGRPTRCSTTWRCASAGSPPCPTGRTACPGWSRRCAPSGGRRPHDGAHQRPRRPHRRTRWP